MKYLKSHLAFRNLKIFASILYHSFYGFVIRSILIKKTDFRSDSDFISKALYDKSILNKSFLDNQKDHEIE